MGVVCSIQPQPEVFNNKHNIFFYGTTLLSNTTNKTETKKTERTALKFDNSVIQTHERSSETQELCINLFWHRECESILLSCNQVLALSSKLSSYSVSPEMSTYAAIVICGNSPYGYDRFPGEESGREDEALQSVEDERSESDKVATFGVFSEQWKACKRF